MPSPIVVWSSLALVGGLCLPEQKKWKPLFDYTNLPPANEVLWEPLASAPVQMEDALKLAAETEGASMRLLSAELKPAAGGAFWDLRVFVGNEDGAPKRVDLQVATAEPKVLRRVELLSLAEEEKATWKVLSEAQVPAEVAVEICKGNAAGVKTEPTIREPRMRKLDFLPVAEAPSWDGELMGNDWKKSTIRRYSYTVDALKTGIKRRYMIDRFSGEPLRSSDPVEGKDGLFLHDFTVGEGLAVTASSKVKVNYRLFLLDNTKLHDTWASKRPETFVIANAPLKGMSAGMVGMHVGGKRKIAMPYHMAFGEAGNELAPPRAMVVCDVVIQSMESD